MATERADDAAIVTLTHHVPPPPPERPAQALKRTHTAGELRRTLSERGLPLHGTKSDLALRVAKHEAFVDPSDVHEHFTARDLRRRLRGNASTRPKKGELCAAYLAAL